MACPCWPGEARAGQGSEGGARPRLLQTDRQTDMGLHLSGKPTPQPTASSLKPGGLVCLRVDDTYVRDGTRSAEAAWLPVPGIAEH